eukprot:7576900-Alexandrium_andersonii.AAC.1
MSASLVGSEMCIRDRGELPSPELLQSVPRKAVSLRATVLGRICDKPETVSYTHLTLPTICSV